MKVWLVSSWLAFEGECPVAVFSSEEKAREYITSPANPLCTEAMTETRYDSSVIFRNRESTGGYTIVPMTIDNPEA